MRRRSFLGLVAAAGTGVAEQREDIRYYAVENYCLKSAAEACSLHLHFGFQKRHAEPLLMLEALAAPHLPQLTVVRGAASLDELSRAEIPFQPQSINVLEAAAGSTGWKAMQGPRIWEWRVYSSPTFHRDPLEIFQRLGIRPAVHARALPELNRTSQAFLIPFDDLAGREKAWTTLASHPEWTSIARPGRLSASMQVSLFRPAGYGSTR